MRLQTAVTQMTMDQRTMCVLAPRDALHTWLRTSKLALTVACRRARVSGCDTEPVLAAACYRMLPLLRPITPHWVAGFTSRCPLQLVLPTLPALHDDYDFGTGCAGVHEGRRLAEHALHPYAARLGGNRRQAIPVGRAHENQPKYERGVAVAF